MRRLFYKLHNEGRTYMIQERTWLHVIWFILMIPINLLALLGGFASLIANYPVSAQLNTTELKYKPGDPMVVTKEMRREIKKELLNKKKKDG